MSKNKIKKGTPNWVIDDVIHSWAYGEGQFESVPAIEQCRITVVKFPVLYAQNVDYGPELMKLRRKDIVRLGWDNDHLDQPQAPNTVGKFSLLTDAIKAVNKTFDHSEVYTERLYPSMIDCVAKNYGKRDDYCKLYFDLAAFEFYHLLFNLGTDAVPFENLPDPKLKTLNQLLAWSRSFEFKRRKLYKAEGFTWVPHKELNHGTQKS